MKLVRSITVLAVAAVATPFLVGSSAARAAPTNHTASSDAGVAPAATGPLAKEDRDFLVDAAQGGMLEVELAQLAKKQGASEDVKRFAQRMIDDHRHLNQQLADFARQASLTLPTALDEKHQAKLDKLARLGGDDLDKQYIDNMVSEHEEDVKAFEHQAKDAKDPGLRRLAALALPTLIDHLAGAHQIQNRITGKK
jgi:putative membrane protein